MKRTLALAALVLALAPSLAEAQIQTSGPQVWPGKIEIAAHVGFTAGLTGGTPGGLKLAAEFGYRLTEVFWLNIGMNAVVGGGGGGCFYRGGYYDCGFFGYGTALEPSAGIKLKFKVAQIPLVPYIKANAVFMGIVNRYCGDNGFGIGGRVGGGVKYFLTKNVGLGVEVSTLFGPAWYNGYNNCGQIYPSHVEFYLSFDAAVGAEFNF